MLSQNFKISFFHKQCNILSFPPSFKEFHHSLYNFQISESDRAIKKLVQFRFPPVVTLDQKEIFLLDLYEEQFRIHKAIQIKKRYSYWISTKSSLEFIKLSSTNKVCLVLVSLCSNTGSIRDDPYSCSRSNSLELIELSNINKVSLKTAYSSCDFLKLLTF